MLSGLLAECQTWCQKCALSRNGFTISLHPGTAFLFGEYSCLGAGVGRASEADLSMHSMRLEMNSSDFSQWLASLHLTFPQFCSASGMTISSKFLCKTDGKFSFCSFVACSSLVLKSMMIDQVQLLQQE